MDIMISMRLHGLIVSSSFGIPSIGLIYDKKITNFLSRIDMEDYLIDLDHFDSIDLENKFEELLNNYNYMTKKIKFNIKESKKEFSSTVEEIVNFENYKHYSITNQIKNIYKVLVMLLPLILNKFKNN
jgi:polysaccharide pyruvyl transferase WcaK-like protein